VRKNYICIDTDSLESISSSIGVLSNDVLDNGNDFLSNSKNVVNSGLMKSSSKKIFSQTKSFGNVLEKGKIMILKSINKMSDTEMYLNSLAEEIVVPKDFVINDTANHKSIDSFSLEKDDGNAVVDGITNLNNIEFDNVVKYNSNLKNLIKSYELKNGELVFSFDDKEKLESIANDKEDKLVHYENGISLKGVNLRTINNVINSFSINYEGFDEMVVVDDET